MERLIEKPVTILQCHPKWFKKEVVDKRKHHEETLTGSGIFRVRDWPQSLIFLNPAMPPEGFYAT